MQKNTRRALIIGALLILVVVIYKYAGPYFSLESLQAKASYLRTLVTFHYARSLCLYGLLYSLVVIIGIPAIGPLTLLGGFLFGALPTIVCALIAIAVGMTTSFLLIRTFFVQRLRVKFSRQLAQFSERTQKYGITYLLTLNLLTIVPFFLINTLAALSNVSLWSLLWTSLVGSAPMVMVYACAGKKFAEIDSISDIFSPSLIALFVVLIALSVVPLIMKRLKYINDLDE
jgi:uncharacterized membrane protein YdjX (TVP38/TMEM64 family)